MDFFGIGILELLLILVVALLVMGPDRLPKVAQRMGNLLVQARRSINEATSTFTAEIEAEPSAPPEGRGPSERSERVLSRSPESAKGSAKDPVPTMPAAAPPASDPPKTAA